METFEAKLSEFHDIVNISIFIEQEEWSTRQKNIDFSMGIIFSLLIIGLALSNVYGENSSDSNFAEVNGSLDLIEKDWRLEPEKIADEEYEINGTESYKHEVIAIYGKLPEFETEEERRYWSDEVLPAIKHDLDKKIVNQYFNPSGPLVLFSYNSDGFEVGVLKNLSIEKQLMDEIYGIIDEEAKERGIQEVPVRFVSADFIQLDEPLAVQDMNPHNETSGKSVPGFGFLSGLVSMVSGWLLRKKQV